MEFIGPEVDCAKKRKAVVFLMNSTLVWTLKHQFDTDGFISIV